MESKTLNLWKQQLGTVPASVWDHTAPETLILADNGLAELPDGIGALTKLRTLDLGHNLLEDLPESLGQLADLADYLYLHDNRLATLRESLFARLIHLRYLNVSDNRLTQLPVSIGNLSSLEELAPTATADDSAGLVRGWRGCELHLRNNQLPQLPEPLRLPRLAYLDLRQPVTEPDWIVEWPNLQKLDLRWVKLSSVPAGDQ